MAYQSIKKPRFYIDYLSHWLSDGKVKRVHSFNEMSGSHPIGLDPTSTTFISTYYNQTERLFHISIDLNELVSQRQLESVNYIAVLGHNLSKINVDPDHSASSWAEQTIPGAFRLDLYKWWYKNGGTEGQNSWRGSINYGNEPEDILNSVSNAPNHYTWFDNDGASIYKAKVNSQVAFDDQQINPETGEWIDPADIENGTYTGEHSAWDLSTHGANVDRLTFVVKGWNSTANQWLVDDNGITTEISQINNISFGHYYDMPHSPDLKLTMSIEYDGSDTITTSGGSTITSVRYHGSPKWGDLNPWEVGKSQSNIRRAGRRLWSLSFSYLSEKDVFSSNYMSNTYLENSNGYDDTDLNNFNWGQDLISNGTFDSDSGWNKNSNWSITGGKAVSDGASSDNISQNVDTSTGAEVDKVYLVRYTISTLTSGTGFYFTYGGVTGTSRERVGTFEEIITTNSAERLRIYAVGNAAGTIDDVSVQKANPDSFNYTLADDNSFAAKILNYVGNGQKFIFQPDNGANNPSDFAICIIDQSSIKVTQVAYKTFNMKLKIMEVW